MKDLVSRWGLDLYSEGIGDLVDEAQPKLETFKLEQMNFDIAGYPAMHLTHKTRWLRRIDLELCVLRPMDAKLSPFNEYEVFQLMRVWIPTFATSLEELRLRFHYWRFWIPDSKGDLIRLFEKQSYEFGWIGDLSRFQKLKVLDIDAEFWTLPAEESEAGMTSADYLPRKLESLIIRDIFDSDIFIPEFERQLVSSETQPKIGLSKEGSFYSGSYDWALDRERIPTFSRERMKDRFLYAMETAGKAASDPHPDNESYDMGFYHYDFDV